MKILKQYEEYINSGSNRVSTLLTNMVKMFKETFEGQNDILGEKELSVLSLVEIEQSNFNDAIEKNIVLSFNDAEFFYQVYFVIKLEDVKNNEPIKNAYLKIKIYDENGKVLREWQSNIEIAESTQYEINNEGRFFVKAKEVTSGQPQGQNVQAQTQPQTQGETGGMDYIESFIISKISDLKTPLEKNNQE